MKIVASVFAVGMVFAYLASLDAEKTARDDKLAVKPVSSIELHAQFTAEMAQGNYATALEIADALKAHFPNSGDTIEVEKLIPRAKTELAQANERNRAEVATLIGSMHKSVDEFTHATLIFAEPKHGQVSSNVSLSVYRSSTGELALVAGLSYGGDGWIFWKTAEFNIDGNTLSDRAFADMEVRRDVFDGSWVIESVTKTIDDTELPLFDQLATGQKVLVRLDGRNRYDFELDAERKDNLRRILRLYRLLKIGTPLS